MSLNSIILKHRIKNTFWDILAYLGVFILAYIFNKPYEMFIYIVSYTFIRNEFTKAIHAKDFTDSSAKAIIYCRLITMAIQSVSIIFLISIDFLRYVNILLALSLGALNFFAKDYLEYHLVKTNLWLLDEQILDGLCVKYNLTDLAKSRLKMRYIDKLKMKEIAQIECVEQDSIEEYFRMLRKRLK